MLLLVVVLLAVMSSLELQLIRRSVGGSVVQPSNDVLENRPDVVGRLAGGESVPHARVELERLVVARRRSVQQLVHRRVCHLVCPAVHDQERQRDLQSTGSIYKCIIQFNNQHVICCCQYTVFGCYSCQRMKSTVPLPAKESRN